MELIARAAALTNPDARHVLDLGCGAGNYTLRLLQYLPELDATLADLSQPMLERARQRVSAATTGRVTTLRGDLRQLELVTEASDPGLAAAVCHHLRAVAAWPDVCATTR